MSISAPPLGNASFGAARPNAWNLGAATLGTAAVGAGAGVLLNSILLLGIAGAIGTGWILVHAPEVFLALLAAEGTLKSLTPFSSLPVDLLTASLGLVLAACCFHVARHGLVRVPVAALPMILLVVLILFAATRTPESGGTYKSVYFAVQGLTLVLAPVLLVRGTDGLARLCAGLVAVAIIVALAATPGADPNQPLTIAGGNEITAALYPAVGAIACLTCLAARSGWLRLIAIPLGAVLVVASVRAGSRGVLLGLLAAAAVAVVVLFGTSRRPVLTLILVTLALASGGLVIREAAGSAALRRYAHLTSDPTRSYLRDRALSQALAHPLGNGIGTFGLNLPELNPRPPVEYPHNVILEVFNEGGLIALGALLALIACAAGKAVRAARHPGWAFAAVGLTLATVEASSSGSVNDNRLFWLTIGIALAAPGATKLVHRART